MNNIHNHKIAMLIDADNASSEIIDLILDVVEKYGNITTKRIYADWTSPQHSRWKEVLNAKAIKPIQKFAYTSGKNSTDTALIIDAMDLLYSKKIDSFCIVSSDSDYTRLALRIREEGMDVIGIGKQHTPESFQRACSIFIKEERFLPKQSNSQNDNVNTAKQNTIPNIDYKIIQEAFELAKDNTNSALLSRFLEKLKLKQPDFKQKNYGFKKFSDFCRSLKGYKVIALQDQTTFAIRKQ